MSEFIKKNKKSILIVSIFLIITIILSIIANIFNKNTNKVLLSSYVSNLTKEDFQSIDSCNTDEVLKDSNVPYFKVSNNYYDKMNNEILYDFLLRACYQNGIVDYDASLNNDILSLAINISYESINDLTYVEYKTYNINIKTNKPIENSTLLSKYNRTQEDATNIVMERLLNYYYYEKEHNYLESKITFNDYLDILQYEPITMENMKLFVDTNNNLWLYKEYNLSEAMMRYEDYPVVSIRFKLT